MCCEIGNAYHTFDDNEARPGLEVVSEDAESKNRAVEAKQNALAQVDGNLLGANLKYWCCRLCDSKSRCLSHAEMVTHLTRE